MSKPEYTIILDFDDVIYPFCEGVMDVLEQEGIARGRRITRWDMHRDFGMERGDFWQTLNKDIHFDRLYNRKLDTRTIAALDDLYQQGHELHIVTARHERLRWITEDIVRLQLLPITEVHFTEDKGSLVSTLNASYSVDDRPRNYVDLDLQVGHDCFLMEAPHNARFRLNSGVRKVQDLTEFAEKMSFHQWLGVEKRPIGQEAS